MRSTNLLEDAGESEEVGDGLRVEKRRKSAFD